MNALKNRDSNEALNNIIGESVPITELKQQISQVAPSDHAVLICGETGSGKELVAKALHQSSHRYNAPFAALNCASISPQLFESELFGHERGAFTGAQGQHKGVFEQVQGGTLFLDEIGELPLDFQAKLLRVLESRSIRRVGGKEEIPINVRVIAATHRDLHESVAKKTFREDLYYRLHVIPLFVPPLRERIEDIPLLVKYFVEQLTPEAVLLTSGAFNKLISTNWPGNVRELKNVISRSLVYCRNNCIQEDDIQFSHASAKIPRRPFHTAQANLIKETYCTFKSVRKVADIFGIGKSTVQRKLKRKVDLEIPE